ncbi:MAG: type II toxin-antitoxin system RelE/ParE family toxin [Geminicoccaceae bacterium]
MRSLRTTKQFERDLRRAKRRGKKLDKIWEIVDLLVRGEPLPARCRRSGEWNRLWECHIEPDWLLIWNEAEQTLTLVRTGTHADLFE